MFRVWAKLVHRKSDELYEDAMIATTALRNDFTVATRNVRDFVFLGTKTLSSFENSAVAFAGPHTISGFSPSAVRSITSRSAKDELILVTCGMADSHSL
jgi:hypothetical protein